MSYESILTNVESNVGVIQLNRPEALNVLSAQLLNELAEALRNFLQADEVRCILIAGNEKAFSAGADIKEMGSGQLVDMLERFTSSIFSLLRRARKPVIAAVGGHCYGGGCELALACDMIVASESAKFGQPEINVGIIPGAGGTQRWTRIVGKARAIEIMLTGTVISAQKALEWGIINRVVPVENLLDEAKRLAAEVASKAPLAVRTAKEAVIKAQDMTLENGLDFENRVFSMLFGTEDQKEGMRAFIEKRKPQWKGR
jgi:enoyl-CoA hydratase